VLGGGATTRSRRDTFLVFGEPLIGDEEIAEVVDTLRSGWIGTGPKTKQLEVEFGREMGTRHALAVSSCTAGLHLALDVLDIGPGDEVVTSPMTFAATANVIEHVGARPVFADAERGTMNIDPSQVAAAMTSRTKAILAVHMAGRACDLGALRAIADDHGVPLIADAAHAIETRYDGRPAAMSADMSVFSFYATKNLTTAEGGMITAESDEWAEKIAVRRLHGLSHDAWKRYSVEGFQPYETLYPGYKYNLTDLQSSLGIHQLRRIEESWRIRDRHVQAYREAFAGMPGILLPQQDTESTNRHAHHLFVVLLDLERLTIDRNHFVEELRSENIGAGIHFIPVHLHRFYREKYGYEPGAFPAAEWIGERTVSLPLSAKLTDEDIEDVVAAVERVLDGALRESE
jgi:dTDP-4-amino-4,6-dideoxygalactose transaminase